MLMLLLQLGIFAAKALIITIMIILVLIVFFLLLAKGKDRAKTKLVVKNFNKKNEETTELIYAETLNKKQLKQFHKKQKAHHKEVEKNDEAKNVYVVNFVGDIKASAVTNLSEEITAILNVATKKDEVLVKIESGGGMVHTYGLAAAQLMRLRAKEIPLVVSVDKVAASGGYLMACVANKIIAAPFAILGSIGVVVQLPNFHRVLKDKHIDYEMQTAGEYKRTLTVFGENTEAGRQKLQEEIEDIHGMFKQVIVDHRPQIDIAKVATGEHWLGSQAVELKLVDQIQTSDDYLLEKSKTAKVFEICYEIKKPMLSKLTSAASLLKENILRSFSSFI